MRMPMFKRYHKVGWEVPLWFEEQVNRKGGREIKMVSHFSLNFTSNLFRVLLKKPHKLLCG